VPGTTNRRAVRWLRGQLPELVAAGVISSDNAKAINRHYGDVESHTNFGFVILATIGAALVGAGIILLIAHNWDDLSRAARTVIAFLPLLIAQALVVFVLMRRNESRAWREVVAIFDVAAVATAISLISQTYQIRGSFDDFMRTWLLLSIPIVYLLRTTLGAVVYIIGTLVWLDTRWSFIVGRTDNPMLFWGLLLLVVPYFWISFRRNRDSRETATLAVVLTVAAIFGLGTTADFAKSGVGCVAFAGLLTTAYLAGMKFFSQPEGERLHSLALLGGVGIGITAIVLSFESAWHMSRTLSWSGRNGAQNLGLAIELLFPIAAIVLAGWDLFRKQWRFSLSATAFPIVTVIAWGMVNLCESAPEFGWQSNRCTFAAATLMNCYTLLLGVDILARGIRSSSIARANFGMLLIAVLAVSRFFDSDLSFLARGLGFIVVGAGFLFANILLFKKRVPA